MAASVITIELNTLLPLIRMKELIESYFKDQSKLLPAHRDSSYKHKDMRDALTALEVAEKKFNDSIIPPNNHAIYSANAVQGDKPNEIIRMARDPMMY